VVYFLAPQVAQSSYWAKQLGFKANEWRHIGRTQDAHGIGPSATVYLVGTWYTSVEIEDILRYFNALNIDCILAEDMVPGERM
jgi:(2Fe-2S) ferredoxin